MGPTTQVAQQITTIPVVYVAAVVAGMSAAIVALWGLFSKMNSNRDEAYKQQIKDMKEQLAQLGTGHQQVVLAREAHVRELERLGDAMRAELREMHQAALSDAHESSDRSHERLLALRSIETSNHAVSEALRALHADLLRLQQLVERRKE